MFYLTVKLHIIIWPLLPLVLSVCLFSNIINDQINICLTTDRITPKTLYFLLSFSFSLSLLLKHANSNTHSTTIAILNATFSMFCNKTRKTHRFNLFVARWYRKIKCTDVNTAGSRNFKGVGHDRSFACKTEVLLTLSNLKIWEDLLWTLTTNKRHTHNHANSCIPHREVQVCTTWIMRKRTWSYLVYRVIRQIGRSILLGSLSDEICHHFVRVKWRAKKDVFFFNKWHPLQWDLCWRCW